MKTKQEKLWEGRFGDEYAVRNGRTPADRDRLNKQYFGITRTTLNKEFLNFLPRDIKILEVGVNTGLQCALLKKMGFKNFYGIDINEKALVQARKNGVQTILASALDIPFKDGYFDLVMTNGLLIHIAPDNLPSVLNEIIRVCNPDGYIYIYEYTAPVCTPINYHGRKGYLWANDFPFLFSRQRRDIALVSSRVLKYKKSKQHDIIALLKRGEYRG